MDKYIYFLAFPIRNLYIGLRDINYREGRNTLLLFFIMYGISFNYNAESDAKTSILIFKGVIDMSYQEFIANIFNIFKGGSDDADYYSLVINFIVSRFTNDAQFIFIIHSLVFSYYYIKSIELLATEFKITKNNINAFVFMVLFITISMIWRIAFVRFYTAGWIFFYYGYLYLKSNNFKYILLTSISILVHFSFIPLFIILLLSNIAKTKISFVLYLVIAVVLLYLISNILNIQTGYIGIDTRITGYSGKDYYTSRNEQFNSLSLIIKIPVLFMRYYTLSLLFYYLMIFKNINKDRLQKLLLTFTLIFASYVIISSIYFAATERYYIILGIFVFAMLYRHYNINKRNQIDKISIIAILLLFFHLILEFRYIFEFSKIVLLTNPFIALMSGLNISIYDFLIKGLK